MKQRIYLRVIHIDAQSRACTTTKRHTTMLFDTHVAHFEDVTRDEQQRIIDMRYDTTIDDDTFMTYVAHFARTLTTFECAQNVDIDDHDIELCHIVDNNNVVSHELHIEHAYVDECNARAICDALRERCEMCNAQHIVHDDDEQYDVYSFYRA